MTSSTVSVCDADFLFHPLHASTPLPSVFNNPFYYSPHLLCRSAAASLQDFLHTLGGSLRSEIDLGKMFGVLVVVHEGRLGYIQAYSGQIAAIDNVSSEDLPHEAQRFVPAVYDYLDADGYFKHHEAEISELNRRITALENNPEVVLLRRELHELLQKAEAETQNYREQMRQSKQKRHELRSLGVADNAALIRESQFQKAELHRIKKRWAVEISSREARLQHYSRQTDALKATRRHMSDNLQRWLFDRFSMLNALGERRTLTEIFRNHYAHTSIPADTLPPSGAGECCEPKLLQYAYTNGMRPIQMAMFWWGASPAGEVRRHLDFYPACNAKCKPVLQWMLTGLDVAPNPLEQDEELSLEVLFEDEAVAVVCKPAGMLSVPGKSKRRSVVDVMRAERPDVPFLMPAHRLDMATSGLLVVAKTKEAYTCLQRQFETNTVFKRYVAKLDNVRQPSAMPKKGTVSLPLCADLNDRPRQKVDYENGKTAITYYEFIDDNLIQLWPKTGRTHQLRLHCAHPDGLNRPIKGDELYGTKASRLCLHASSIEFAHPETGRRMKFESKENF